MPVRVIRGGKPVEYDEINVTGGSCLLLVLPWLLGIVYLVWAVIILLATLIGAVVGALAA